jgi:hypothetical protein
MSAEIRGIPQLKARIEAITPNRELLRTIALSAVREQKLMTLPFRKTGNLGRSIHIGAVTPTRAETIASADYATFVETGTRPHTIRPRNRKALRWAASAGDARLSGTPRSGGRVRFAKRVQHPGTRAQPFMVPGAKKAVEQGVLKATVVNAWNDAA